MYQADRDDFTKLLDKLAATYGKQLTDDLRSSYWGALKDQPIGQVVACANTHMRYGKHFPRPVELRPKDEKPPAPTGNSGSFLEGERRANERLESLRVSDPDEWLKQVGPKVYEMGRARGMLDGEIVHKLQEALRKGVCVGPRTN